VIDRSKHVENGLKADGHTESKYKISNLLILMDYYTTFSISALVPFRDYHIRLKGFSPESNINQYMDDACVAMEKDMF
jgi:hypothetical protein